MYSAVGSRFKLGLLIVFLGVTLSAGCETVHFYQQATWGQLRLLHARTPVAEVAQDAEVDDEVVIGLRTAGRIIRFAEGELSLPANGRYQSYVALDRDHVLWNLFAAEAYSTTGVQWCYPLVGCAPYRGYFSFSAAQALARKYNERGFETYVGGVPAYSTLGWFDDPLLSSFILWPEADLANLLIHELAHSRIWVRGDVAFNESFAEFTGNMGAAAWLDREDKAAAWRQWVQERSGWRRFRTFLEAAKAYLHDVYQSPAELVAARKTAALADIQACYAAQRQLLGEGRYDQIMAEEFNNALLVSISTYADWIPAFAALYEQAGGDWQQFFAAVEELADEKFAARQLRLQALAQQQKSQRGNDQHAEQVNCEAFSGHRAYGETAG